MNLKIRKKLLKHQKKKIYIYILKIIFKYIY